MQVTFACPGCGLSKTVDPDSLPHGAQFSCLGCPTVFRVNADGTIAAARPSTSPPAPLGEGVNCPACGHHFAVGGPSPSPAEPATHSAQPSVSRGKPTILVVEDTAFFRELVRDTLAPKYRVLVCSSKAEALQLIKTEPLELLLLDLSLDDDVDGREVLKEMGPKSFRVLVFTARDESDLYGEVWRELQTLGVDDMLIKGMNVADALLSKVEELLTATC